MAWLSAQYHKYAVHQPNDMPDDPGVGQVRGGRADRDFVRAWFKSKAAMSGKAANGS